MMGQYFRQFESILLLVLSIFPTKSSSWQMPIHICEQMRRRDALLSAITFIESLYIEVLPSTASTQPTIDPFGHIDDVSFSSLAYGQEEYTNSITASRDTNLSPAEAYDIIRQMIPRAAETSRGVHHARVADLGAGAGLSTTILFAEKGYRNIAAVDWSRTAWDAAVAQSSGHAVRFYEMDDDTFFRSLSFSENREEMRFDAIIYNFAVNKEKAEWVAQHYLTPEGVLLAPCNDTRDYWYKQSYLLLNQAGTILWSSGANAGAWYIQFQPDVTSPDCIGIWCGKFNGFFDQMK